MNKIVIPNVLNEKKKSAGKVLATDAADILSIQLAKGESIAEHKANEPVVIIVRKGAVNFTVSGEVHELTDEHIITFERDELHSLIAVEDTELVLVKIHH